MSDANNSNSDGPEPRKGGAERTIKIVVGAGGEIEVVQLVPRASLLREPAAPQVVEAAPVPTDPQPEGPVSESESGKPSDAAVSIRDVQKGNLGQIFAKRPGRSVWLTGTRMPAFTGEELGFQWTPKDISADEAKVISTDDAMGDAPLTQNEPGMPTISVAGFGPKMNSINFIHQPKATDADARIAETNEPIVRVNEQAADAHDQAARSLSQAKSEFQCGQFESALEHYEESLSLLDASVQPDIERICSCLTDLIDVYMFLGRPQDALAASRRLHDVDRGRKKDKNYILVLMKTAAACERSGSTALAEEAYLEAIALAGQLLPADDPLPARLNKAFGDMHKKQQKPKLSSREEEGAQQVLAASRRQPTDWLDKPTPTPPKRPDSSNVSHSRKVGKAAGRPLDMHAILHGPGFMILVSVLFLFLFAAVAIQFLRGSSNVAMPGSFAGMHFESCDKINTIKFLSRDECAIFKSGLQTKAKYTLLSDDRPDLAMLFRGYMRRNEVWYQYEDAGLVGNDRIVFYTAKAPELAIVKKMWWYANFAEHYYEEGRLYPADAEKCKQSDAHFVYKNPVTHQSDYASIILQKNMSADINLTSRGSNDRHWRPGAIFCLCTDYKKFLIQGFDRDGKPLTSSDPSRYFTITCENGNTLTKAEQPQTQDQPQNDTATRVFVYKTPDLEGSVQWLRRIIQVFLWTLLCLACFWCYATHKSKYSRKARLSTIVAIPLLLLCLAAWYIFAFSG